jgi:hypothetical protein
MLAMRDRGQSLVEMTVGLMFLLVLLAGIVDVGRALFAQVALASVDFSDTDNVNISVQYPGAACAGHLLRVVVNHDFMLTTPFMGTILGSQEFALSSSAETLILSPECP